jgi:serine/threonine-protein kinase
MALPVMPVKTGIQIFFYNLQLYRDLLEPTLIMSEKSDPSVGQVIGGRYQIEEKLSGGAKGAIPLTDPLIGQVIQDRYRIGKVLGAGGMGKVYLAQQLDLERPVAFKVLLSQFAHDNEFLLRFRREARQLATLRDHSRVVHIYGSGELHDGRPFIVMEYVDGPTLQEVIKTTGPLPLSRAVALGIQIAEGLREAHRVNIVHRDIKPANIKVWESADGEAVKILDFGIAQAVNPETWMQITHTNVIIGSPKYMAPETFHPRLSIASLGFPLPVEPGTSCAGMTKFRP